MTRILGISGSLRERSYNTALLREAAELAPPDVEVELFDLSEIPLYNDDVESVGDPEPVAKLRAAVAEADALLFATPEYNRGTSGVLKNAIDWLSRPALASGTTEGMTDPVDAPKRLYRKAARGNDDSAPLIVLSGLTLAIGLIVGLLTAAVLFVYFLV